MPSKANSVTKATFSQDTESQVVQEATPTVSSHKDGKTDQQRAGEAALGYGHPHYDTKVMDCDIHLEQVLGKEMI